MPNGISQATTIMPPVCSFLNGRPFDRALEWKVSGMELVKTSDFRHFFIVTSVPARTLGYQFKVVKLELLTWNSYLQLEVLFQRRDTRREKPFELSDEYVATRESLEEVCLGENSFFAGSNLKVLT